MELNLVMYPMWTELATSVVNWRKMIHLMMVVEVLEEPAVAVLIELFTIVDFMIENYAPVL